MNLLPRHRIARGFAACLLLISGLMSASNASAIIIDISPTPQNGEVGDSFIFDVVASDFKSSNEIISAFDISIGYDSSIVTLQNSVHYGGLGGSADSLLVTSSGVGTFEIAELSYLFDFELAALQTDPLTLFSLEFLGIANGVSNISLLPGLDGTVNFVGNNFTSLTVSAINNGQVRIGPTPVSEPPMIALALIATMGLGWARRRRIG